MDIFKKNMGVQHAPSGYSSKKIQVNKPPCSDCKIKNQKLEKLLQKAEEYKGNLDHMEEENEKLKLQLQEMEGELKKSQENMTQMNILSPRNLNEIPERNIFSPENVSGLRGSIMLRSNSGLIGYGVSLNN